MAIRVPRFDQFGSSSRRASRIAKAIRRNDTKPEVALRKALWAIGLRYRKNVRGLPGKPDIVFARAKLVIFCDGDFWHGRDWESRRLKLRRGANPGYWLRKIEANMERDVRVTSELSTLGWTVVRFWEGDLDADLSAAVARITRLLKLGT